jgi:hypothetical protein
MQADAKNHTVSRKDRHTMSDSKVLRTFTITNLAELISILRNLSANDLHTVPDFAVNVFGKEGEPIRLRLIKDTLTDGSEVYNINLE